MADKPVKEKKVLKQEAKDKMRALVEASANAMARGDTESARSLAYEASKLHKDTEAL